MNNITLEPYEYGTFHEAVHWLIITSLEAGEIFVSVEEDFDIDAIADEVIDSREIIDENGYSRGVVFYQCVDTDEFWEIVRKHARPMPLD
ncbi:hypothetical protein [Schaalia sp. lx-100]|uniref:hypothetical protein n=1 Tax=Schaalia sp. lx-100 TaxID=2899081 RepID=UPI001E6524E0|nr:hypothetical protein [Schaalia sp. lx-100]MCD4558215.1 hypothetical protein [Schaalia sp. lx-100]